MRAIAMLLIAALPAAAQTPAQDWDNVKALTTGTEVRVRVGSRLVRGETQGASEDSLSLSIRNHEETFKRQEIRRVSVRTTGSRGRHVGNGAVIGGLTGAALGGGVAAAAGFVEYAPAVAAVLGGAGAAVGALVGFAVPAGGWREVYRK